MDQINEVMSGLQRRFMAYFRDWLDPGYYILSVKQNPLSKE
jgi:hypothetical protein